MSIESKLHRAIDLLTEVVKELARDDNRRWVLEQRKAREAGHAAGGRARAAVLTPERRTEIARKAGKARWNKATQGDTDAR